MKGKRFAAIDKIKTESKKELMTIGTKMRISAVLRGLEKALPQVYYIQRKLLLRGQNRY